MKKTFISGILFTSLMFAPTTQTKANDFCDVIDSTAETIMSARQSGVPMQHIITVYKENLDDISAVKEIILDAYSVPQYRVRENKRNAITEFRNKWYHGCLQSDFKGE